MCSTESASSGHCRHFHYDAIAAPLFEIARGLRDVGCPFHNFASSREASPHPKLTSSFKLSFAGSSAPPIGGIETQLL